MATFSFILLVRFFHSSPAGLLKQNVCEPVALSIIVVRVNIGVDHVCPTDRSLM